MIDEYEKIIRRKVSNLLIIEIRGNEPGTPMALYRYPLFPVWRYLVFFWIKPDPLLFSTDFSPNVLNNGFHWPNQNPEIDNDNDNGEAERENPNAEMKICDYQYTTCIPYNII